VKKNIDVDTVLNISNILSSKVDYKDLIKMASCEADKFSTAVEFAMKSGKLLAYLLILNFLHIDEEVDLIGFSLGTQVIKD